MDLFLHRKQEQRLHLYVVERVAKSPYCENNYTGENIGVNGSAFREVNGFPIAIKKIACFTKRM